eukprot:2243788-Ditylum_brightwellii.AAC.1
MRIGVVGVSCHRKGWPPKDLCAVTQQESNFNNFYWCIDEYGTLLGRWLHNGMVFCISTVSKVGGMLKRARRRSSIMVLKKNTQKMFGVMWGRKKSTSPGLLMIIITGWVE